MALSDLFSKLAARRTTVTLVLFLLSFVLHLGLVIALAHYKEPRLWENGGIAKYMLDGKGFSGGLSITGEPTSWQAPGYPVLLVAFWKTIGQNSLAYFLISMLQCAAVAAMVWPMGWLSSRWFPQVPSVIVQITIVLAPLYLWYVTRLHHSALVMAVHPWLLYGWIKWSHENLGKAVGIGALTGLTALFQPTILGLYGVVGLGLLSRFAWQKQWRSFGILAVAGMVVVLCLVPWTIRNYQVHGKLILIKSSFGKELWMGNNPHATGTGYALGGAEEITYAYPPKCFELRGKVPEIELMAALQKEAIDFMKKNPGQFLKLTGEKVLWFWTLPPKDRVRTTGAAEAVMFRGVYATYWIALVGLAVLGFLRGQPIGREYLLLTIFFCLFFSLVYGLTHVGQARFRGEMEFIFFPAAAAGLWWLWTLLSKSILQKP